MRNKLSKKQKEKIFTEVVSATPIPDISYEGMKNGRIPVVYVKNNEPISQDLIKKYLDFESNLQQNDYSDINNRPLLIQYVNIKTR